MLRRDEGKTAECIFCRLNRDQGEDLLFLCHRGLQFEVVLIYLGMQGRAGKAEQFGGL